MENGYPRKVICKIQPKINAVSLIVYEGIRQASENGHFIMIKGVDWGTTTVSRILSRALELVGLIPSRYARMLRKAIRATSPMNMSHERTLDQANRR
jgi:hypothetical protein